MIAILGASGYIGRSLARQFVTWRRPLHLFCREPSRLHGEQWPGWVRSHHIGEFDARSFTMIVNAIGVGDPAQVAKAGADIVRITEDWDMRILGMMGSDSSYVFLSSGAIYGELSEPANDASRTTLPTNFLAQVSPYLLSKLQSEIRHRFTPSRHILDVRVFGYADTTLSPQSTFFLAELANAIERRTVFTTSTEDMIRDYCGAVELADLIGCWEKAGSPNCALDLYSRTPVSKFDLLEAARDRYGLKLDVATAPPNGNSNRRLYASSYKAAEVFGYSPRRTALKATLDTLDYFAS